jgi:ribose-phosphate pyrophosphokinase
MSVPLIVSGSAHPAFGSALGRELGAGSCTVERFPDGELQIAVGAVQGRDVFVVQPLVAPIGEALLELVLIADACHRTGARSVSAVVPYLGYARQERRTREGQPLGARVVGRLVSAGDFARVVVVDLHAAAVEGFFSGIVDHLSAAPLLGDTLAARPQEDGVIVSPDLGAAKLARRFAARLKLPTAVVYKTRLSGSAVTAEEVVGEVRGRRPIIVDDMISTGGTIEAAIRAALSAGAIADITVVATHGLFVGPATERLRVLPIRRLLVTDTVPSGPSSLSMEVASVVPMLATAVRRICDGQPLGDLLASP